MDPCKKIYLKKGPTHPDIINIDADEAKAVAVYCASSLGNHKAFQAAALSLGKALAQAGRPLVYGSGSEGIMGIVSGTVLMRGGHVIGVVPQAMVDAGGEVAQTLGALEDDDEVSQSLKFDRRGKVQMVIVESMHSRKIEMARRASGFIALPGGIGTFEEILDALTLSQIGFHNKPIIVLNVLSYFNPLRDMIRRGVELGFIYHQNEHLIQFIDGPPNPEDHVDFDWGRAALEAVEDWKGVARMNQYNWNNSADKDECPE